MTPWGEVSVEDDHEAWSATISGLLGRQAVVLSAHADRDGNKAHGMTHSVTLTIECDGQTRRAFLKTPQEDLYGETLHADMSREVEWRIEGYPRLPGHVRCIASGRTTAGGLVPVPLGGRPWTLEWEVPGTRYADRLAELDRIGVRTACAEARQLCTAMVAMHQPMTNYGDAMAWYRRSLRDALINPIHRLLDAADSFWTTRSTLRDAVEHRCADWRVAMAGLHHRLRQVHLDFHPWNVFYDEETGEVRTIGARLPGAGDPYDDFVAFAVNYLWFAHRGHGRVGGVYAAAFQSFRETYLELTEDRADPALLAPFLAKRLLVLLNPVYYPTTPAGTTAWLERLLWRCVTDGVDLLHGNVDELAGSVSVEVAR